MVTINIGRKELFFFVGVLVLLVGAGFGVAYGGNQPDVVGHSAGEIEGLGGASIDYASCVEVSGESSMGECPSGSVVVGANFWSGGASGSEVVKCCDLIGGGSGGPSPANCVWEDADRLDLNSKDGYYVAGIGLGGCGRSSTSGCVKSIYWCQ